MQRIRVWDLPTRLFHWTVALCVVGLFATGKLGGRAMQWHALLGYAVASLLLFRLLWGVAGGHWSRFASFAHSPKVVFEYLRGQANPAVSVGHSPSGAGSVYALLLLLAAQVGTGLFSDDRAEFAGPLNIFVSNDIARLLTGYHKNVGEPALIVLVLLHVVAIAYCQVWKRQDLLGPMIHGDKTLPFSAPPSRDDGPSRALALLLFALCCTGVIWMLSVAG
jgi:cytochrome b